MDYHRVDLCLDRKCPHPRCRDAVVLQAYIYLCERITNAAAKNNQAEHASLVRWRNHIVTKFSIF